MCESKGSVLTTESYRDKLKIGRIEVREGSGCSQLHCFLVKYPLR